MHRSLSSWLAWQETLHHSSIDLGLDRVSAVLQRLQFSAPACPVITIAGTKGKGSSATMLASIYRAAGYRTGLFTSPHLQRYNERIRINDAEIADESLCVAFERIDKARGDISLTYFEFNTLAALLVFESARLDVWMLEVGMGGRLDAVNVIDADVAIVTSIGLDHTEWLGNDVESIAREKAGIFRRGKPALYGATEMPLSIRAVANETGALLIRAGSEFGMEDHGDHWSWWMREQHSLHRFEALPLPAITGAVQLQNASVCLAAVQLLASRLPVNRMAIELGLKRARLAGRFQRVELQRKGKGRQQHGVVEWILDVAHNPMSASVLAQHLRDWNRTTSPRRTIAIIGMLSDKDVHGTIQMLHDVVNAWIAVGVSGARALPAQHMRECLQECGATVLATVNDVAAACETAMHHVNAGDRVLVCGSFMTVGPALTWLEQYRGVNQQLVYT